MRNGTWVPSPDDPYGLNALAGADGVRPGWGPGAIGGAGRWGRGRVDLSRKPGMWDVYLGGGSGYGVTEKGGFGYNGDVGGSGYGCTGEGREWDAIKPVSVTYVSAPTKKPAVTPVGVPVGVSDAGHVQAGQVNVSQQEGRSRRGIVRRAGTFVADLFRPPRPEVIAQRQQNANAIAIAIGGMAAGGTVVGEEEQESVQSGEVHGGQKVRVAVLIAMPRPPSVPRHPSTAASSSGESSTGTPALPHPLSSSTLYPEAQEDGEGEQLLPVLEIGVAEVMVAAGEDEENERREVGEGKLDGARDSASFVEGVNSEIVGGTTNERNGGEGVGQAGVGPVDGRG